MPQKTAINTKIKNVIIRIVFVVENAFFPPVVFVMVVVVIVHTCNGGPGIVSTKLFEE